MKLATKFIRNTVRQRLFSTKCKFTVMGGQELPFINTPDFVDPFSASKIPVYRLVDEDGNLKSSSSSNYDFITEERAVNMYEVMIRLNTMDNIFYDAQRQGRISFYMTSYGEEGIHIGSAAALHPTDLIMAQYREAGVLMYRGFSLEKFADQCFSNTDDNGKGRQMPVHYGSNELHYQTISSPLGTQIPQASGAAYALKRDKKNKKIVVAYFGEGAASEGDFHAALNIAATRDCPVMFFVRNNGFAISTPASDQFRGDGIASRAAGYGMQTIRVDGNDIWAVYDATARAREIILKDNTPVLVEAMSYRQGHHSTSDDSTRYRDIKDIKAWKKDGVDPISRLKRFMMKKEWWTEERDANLKDAERQNVLAALMTGEAKAKPPLSSMFEDVYDEKTPNLVRQEEQMLSHVAKYPDHY